MALRRLFAAPPFKTPIVAVGGSINQSWLVFFNAIGRLGQVRIVDAVTDPPTLAAGAAATVALPCLGARPGDFATPSFTATAAGIVLTAQVTANDIVTVVFLNISGGAVDLAQGTLRVRVEQQA